MEQDYKDLKNYDRRKLQLIQADMLKDLKVVCEKHNIRFYLNSGTLLGAVRHKGFIPWDNDIDVEMPYEDYVRFLNLSQEEIGSKYFIQTSDTDEDWFLAYARLRLNNTTMMYDYHTKFKIHHGIWIDIFPRVEINGGLEWKFKKLLFKLAKIFSMEESQRAVRAVILERTGKRTENLSDLLYMLFYEFIYTIFPKKFRKKCVRKMLKYIYTAKNKDNYCAAWCWLSRLIPKNLYDGASTMLEFEGDLYPAPPEYDKWLTIAYGDYMTPPPENERATHDGLIVDFDNDYSKYMDVN